MLKFPTAHHAEIAARVSEYAQRLNGVDTVLVVNSCARGQAVPESDLDMAILMSPPIDEAALEAEWLVHRSSDANLTQFCDRSPFSAIHLDFFDGSFTHEVWDDGGGPDDFEIEIGNRVAYASPLMQGGARFVELCETWLPYYETELRESRLRVAKAACLHDLEFIPFYVGRGLYLQAFERLYKALREYLQALFIAHRTYPLAYNKWLAEQLGWIRKPELLEPLLSILSVPDLRSADIIENAADLRELADDLID